MKVNTKAWQLNLLCLWHVCNASLQYHCWAPRTDRAFAVLLAMQVLAIALLLLYVTGSFADQHESSPGSGDQESSDSKPDPVLTSVEAARRNVRFEASKCKGANGGKAEFGAAVKPGGCSGQSRTTFACCTTNGACQLPRAGEDFKGSGCRYLWWGACCGF